MQHLIVYIMLDYHPPFDKVEIVDHQDGWSSSLGANARVQHCLRSRVRTSMAVTWEFPPVVSPRILAFS